MADQDDQPSPIHVPIRGKDLPGAVNVLPAGLSEVLAKRESREINFEQSGSSMSFSTGLKSGTRVEQTFSTAAKSSASSSFMSTQSQGQFSSFQSGSSSTVQHQSVSKSLTHGLHTSSFQTSNDHHHQQQQQQLQQQQHHEQRVLNEQKVKSLHHGEEIEQESLKHTLQSAITDIEDQIDGVDFEADKENTLPVEQIQETQQRVHQEQHYQQVQEHHQIAEKNESHSYNKQNGFAATDSAVVRRFKFPHEFKGRPHSVPDYKFEPEDALQLPEVGPGSKRHKTDETMSLQNSAFSSSKDEYSQQSTTMNGIYHEDSGSMSNHRIEQDLISGEGSSSVMEKFLNAGSKIDSGSLKRRNPRQMFTDSAFYSPKFHPSIAEQVEMAHKLSSSLYDDGNKLSKGQEMYLKRLKKSGIEGFEIEEPPAHDKVPNLKLVMNPEGKVQDWTDLPEDELPELQQIASGGPSAEIAQNVVENLQACKGRGGELFAKRRKKADKWIVDESSIGSNAPSQFADHFVQQQMFQQHQFQMQQQEEHQFQRQRVEEEQELERIERQKNQEEQQMIFHQQQKMKQQQSMEIRQQKQQVQDMPPNFKPYSLKGRCFTPTFDTSIHNVQGINVWANKAPKPFGKSSTLPRSAGPSANKTTYAESPDTTNHAELSQQQSFEQQQVQVQQQESFEQQQVQVQQQQQVVRQQVQQQQQVVQQQVHSSSQQQQLVVESSEAVLRNQADIEEAKKREYEIWFKNQEKEQEMLEYDCSVKYQEKQQAGLNSDSVVATQDSIAHASTTQHTEKHFLQTGYSQSTTTTTSHQEQQHLIEQQLLLEEQRVYEEKMRRLEIEDKERQKEIYEEEQRLLQQQQEQQRLLLQQQEQQRLLRQQEEQRQLQLQEEQRLFQLQEQQRLQEERRLIQEQEQRRILEEQERQEYLLQQEQQRLLQEQQRVLQQQQEQQRLLQQQQEQQRLFQQQQEQQRLMQQQEEQQRLLRQQEEERQLQLQEQQRLFQQQEQQRLQDERRLIQEQEQRRILEEQHRQEYLLQQQANLRLMEEQRQFEIEEEQRKLRYNEEQLRFQQEQKWQQESQQQFHHQTELSMQMKSGGFLYQQSEGSLDYVGNQAEEYEVEMRKTSSQGRRDVRQSGVFVGIAGESNSLIADNEAFDYEKHTVRSLVSHFSKAKPREMPKQVAQHYQNSQAPPLSYLREQAKSKQYQFQEKTQVVEAGQETKEETSRAQELMNRRRNSLKDYLLMEMNDGTNGSGHQIKDPSAILIGGKDNFLNIEGGQPLPHFSLRSQSASPSILMMKSMIKPPTPKPFGIPQEARPPQPRRLVKPEPIKLTQPNTPPPTQPRVHDLSNQCIYDEQTQIEHNTNIEYKKSHLQQVEVTQQLQAQASRQASAQQEAERIRVEMELRQIELNKQQDEQQRQLELRRQQEEQRRQLELQMQQEEHQRKLELQRQQEEQLRLLELQRQQEEQQRQIELRRQQEEQQRLFELQRQQEEQQRQIELRRQQEEQQRLLELQRQQEEQQRQFELHRQQEEQQRQIELRRQQEEQQRQVELRRQQEEQKRQIELRRQQEEQQRQFELQRQQEEQQRQLELQRQQEEQQRQLELRRQQEEQQRQLELRRQQEEQQRQLELRRLQEEQQRQLELCRQQEEQQRLIELRKQQEEQQIQVELQKQQEQHLKCQKLSSTDPSSSSDDDSGPHYVCEAKTVCRPYPSPLTIPTVMSPSLHEYSHQFQEHFGHQSIDKRSSMLYTPGSRPSSKMSIEQMMEELNEPLPPMQPLPTGLLKDFQQLSTSGEHTTAYAIQHSHQAHFQSQSYQAQSFQQPEWQPEAQVSNVLGGGYGFSKTEMTSSKTLSSHQQISTSSSLPWTDL